MQKISEALSKDIDSIPDLNRALLVDDVLNLARISKLSYQEAFDNLQFLKNDPSYYTWSSAYSGYRFLLQRFTADSFEGKELRVSLIYFIIIRVISISIVLEHSFEYDERKSLHWQSQ